MANAGLYRRVKGVFPSITNVNNVSIACAAWPCEHGITGNSYFDETTGKAEYMNAAELIQMETIFRRAARSGVRSCLLTSKRKTVELFEADTETEVAAEAPPPHYINRYGSPADIYSREINYWLWNVAVDILRCRPDIGLIYVHTTDYAMHTWSPEHKESQEHLNRLDAIIGEASSRAHDAAFFFTADHGMNHKRRCWDLVKVCKENGTPIRFSLSPERDYYIKHHRNFTGCAYVWLASPLDADRITRLIRKLEGVEEIIPGSVAAKRFHLVPERIGDLVVTGDKDTMFGEMESAYEALPTSYRSHGSLHEMDLPLIIYNYAGNLPASDTFRVNKDLTHFLFRK
jgi:phosphonoacetate hydrolase